MQAEKASWRMARRRQEQQLQGPALWLKWVPLYSLKSIYLNYIDCGWDLRSAAVAVVAARIAS